MSRERDESVWDDLTEGNLSPEDEAVLRALSDGDDAHLEAYSPLDDQARQRIADNLVEQVQTSRRRTIAAWGGGVLAVAAAALLMVWSGGDGPVLDYQLQLNGGLRSQRSTASGTDVPRFDRHTTWELLLRPKGAVDKAPQVSAFLVAGKRIVPWPVALEVADSGAMRLSGEAGSLLPFEAGKWQVAIVLAHELPDQATQLRWIRESDPHVLRAEFLLVD